MGKGVDEAREDRWAGAGRALGQEERAMQLAWARMPSDAEQSPPKFTSTWTSDREHDLVRK